jgi:prepilin-type N-terminal cleavage/methylation domain-containing protein
MTKKSNVNSRKGFTIIEVALVLAIAGLIFMMVFIALPALQRSQRDTQRSNDMSRVSTALNNFAANNRGKIPTKGKSLYIAGHTEPVTDANGKDSIGSWGYFYDSYLLVGSAGQTDSFTDPDGEPYSLWVQECNVGTNKTNGTQCNDNQQRYNKTFDQQSEATLTNENTATSSMWPTTGEKIKGHSIAILTHATCKDEIAVYSSGSRKVAILYKKEGGGAVCVNN